jgi:arylsulfatase A-like enzyme
LLTSASLMAPQLEIISPFSQEANSSKPNILILLFDAWSARHISLYGYPRETTPNLRKLAQKATIYHNHHSAANFTGPSTVSLLTGVYPWKHHGFQGFTGAPPEYFHKNMFSALHGYTRMAYSQNPLPNRTFIQMSQYLEDLIIPHDTAILENSLIDDLFRKDLGIALKSELEIVGNKPKDLSNSLLSSLIRRYWRDLQNQKLQKEIHQKFPVGPISIGFMKFILEDTLDWAVKKLGELSNPFFSYLHFFPPHDPYHPRADFTGRFDDDGWKPIEKPEHRLNDRKSQEFLNSERAIYDAYIAYVDAEIGRTFDSLEKTGILENTIVILTSDHGEMFERGIFRHQTPTLYEQIIHIPLMIFEPGQTTRRDVYNNTSTLDLLPTIAHWAGNEMPTWGEGKLLPPYHPDPSILIDRPIFAMDSRSGSRAQPPTRATFAMIKENYKLIHYYGFRGVLKNKLELYDLEADPEEMNDLFSTKSQFAKKMKKDLFDRIEDAGSIYQ